MPVARRFAGRGPWLAARRIGSSDVPRILTRAGRPLSPYGGPRDVQRRLLGEPIEDEDPDPDRVRGSKWEPVVIAAAQAETGRRIRRVAPHTLYDGPEPWVTVSPDSFVEDLEVGEVGIGELKTDARFRWGPSRVVERWDASLATEIREDHAYQAYYQAWALGMPWTELIVLLPFYDVRVYRLVRDPDLEAAMVSILAAWYDRHILAGEPCAPDQRDRDASLIERTRPMDARGSMSMRPATPSEAQLAQQLDLATQLRDHNEMWRRAMSLQLVEKIGRARGLMLDRDGRRRVHVVRRDGAVPYAQITERNR